MHDGDLITLDAEKGRLDIECEPALMQTRACATPLPEEVGFGRELYANFRRAVGSSDEGASVFTFDGMRVGSDD